MRLVSCQIWMQNEVNLLAFVFLIRQDSHATRTRARFGAAGGGVGLGPVAGSKGLRTLLEWGFILT